jgi:hypothetical protein
MSGQHAAPRSGRALGLLVFAAIAGIFVGLFVFALGGLAKAQPEWPVTTLAGISQSHCTEWDVTDEGLVEVRIYPVSSIGDLVPPTLTLRFDDGGVEMMQGDRFPFDRPVQANQMSSTIIGEPRYGVVTLGQSFEGTCQDEIDEADFPAEGYYDEDGNPITEEEWLERYGGGEPEVEPDQQFFSTPAESRQDGL